LTKGRRWPVRGKAPGVFFPDKNLSNDVSAQGIEAVSFLPGPGLAGKRYVEHLETPVGFQMFHVKPGFLRRFWIAP
jgi:hypothetical protein